MPDLVEAIRSRIEERVGAQRYKVWFKNATHLSLVDDHLRIGVPNQFIGTWIETHFSAQIREAATAVLNKPPRLHFSIDPKLFGRQPPSQLDTQAETIRKMQVSSNKRPAAKMRSPFDTSADQTLRYTLKDFVVAGNSQLAYAAVRDILDNPSRPRNPLYIYASCGLGKTHLLQGLCHSLQAEGRRSWAYVTGEQFTNDFVYAIRTRQTQAFREWYRHLDVLVIDDVHFLANKKATQEELQHTFDSIEAHGKQIVMASDSPPKLLPQLSPSLINRFLASMIVKLESPDTPTRQAILRRKAATLSQPVPEPIIQYVADLFQSNVRELEGALLKLAAFSRLVGQPITPNLARSALEEYAKRVHPAVRVSDIEAQVCSYFGLTPADLHSTNKTRTVALARNIAMYLTRRQTSMSFPEIAKHMGGKNHATVLLACRKIDQNLAANASIKWTSAAGLVTRPVREVIEQIAGPAMARSEGMGIDHEDGAALPSANGHDDLMDDVLASDSGDTLAAVDSAEQETADEELAGSGKHANGRSNGSDQTTTNAGRAKRGKPSLSTDTDLADGDHDPLAARLRAVAKSRAQLN